MKGSFKFDYSVFRAAVRKLAALPGSKPIQQVMKTAAAQFLRRVIGITPPAKGKADSKAKKAGEEAIAVDLAKIMVPAARRIKRVLEEPQDVWERFRKGGNGRVNPRNLQRKIAVDKAKLRALQKELQSRVGTLAAGFNAAANSLGVSLPAWIRRHGSSYGAINIVPTTHGIRITIQNRVRFAGDVKDLQRRMQYALNQTGKSIVERQIPAALKRLASQAGFKVR